jgi:hypothetical protein
LNRRNKKIDKKQFLKQITKNKRLSDLNSKKCVEETTETNTEIVNATEEKEVKKTSIKII